ncbi:MAG: polyprenyl synthetase family protein [Mycobacteriaceae bacterium]
MTTALTPVLDRSRALVLPALRAAVDTLDPTSRDVTAYHLGWTDADGSPCASGGGKTVRPALALLSAELAGAPAEQAIPGAVAVELVHNFSLLHDDVMDGDTQRRHRATVWSLWGESCAILTGDAQLVLAQQVLCDSGSAHATAATRLLLGATAELIRGQVEDLAFESRDRVTVQECLRMAVGKTGALLSASAAIGAVLAGAPAGVVAALSAYGRHLGAAFQLVDDLLGIWGDPAVTGKPVLSDLRSRKKSLPVTWTLAADDAAAHELAAWYSSPTTDDAGLTRAAELVEIGGGRAWAAAEARRRMELAGQALAGVRAPAGPRAELLALGRFIVDRDV